jgi:peroxiredoxin
LRRQRVTPLSTPCRKLRRMLAVGDSVPDATLWLAPGERVSLLDVVEELAALFFFYLFDWSST